MIDEQTIVHARALVASLEAGNDDEAKHNLDSLSAINENNLFREIGRLTRDLHDTLNNFHLDNRLTSLAAQDIPDAKDRLEYVLALTADAANKTMDAVEKGISITDAIKGDAGTLNEGWTKVRNKELEGVAFRELCSKTETFISSTASDSIELHDLLNQALMAQDFQDLTGQVLKRVIKMVHDVEESMVETIKMFGAMSEYNEAVEEGKKEEKGASGPTIHTENRDDVVSSQDDVDDLLSSLGF